METFFHFCYATHTYHIKKLTLEEFLLKSIVGLLDFLTNNIATTEKLSNSFSQAVVASYLC